MTTGYRQGGIFRREQRLVHGEKQGSCAKRHDEKGFSRRIIGHFSRQIRRKGVFVERNQALLKRDTTDAANTILFELDRLIQLLPQSFCVSHRDCVSDTRLYRLLSHTDCVSHTDCMSHTHLYVSCRHPANLTQSVWEPHSHRQTMWLLISHSLSMSPTHSPTDRVTAIFTQSFCEFSASLGQCVYVSSKRDIHNIITRTVWES